MIIKSIKNLAKRSQILTNLYAWFLFLKNIRLKDLLDIKKIKLIFKVRPYTMLWYPRLSNLYEIATYLETNKIQGSFVECGVYKGGSAGILAAVAKDNKERNIWLFDSWEGQPEPTEWDVACCNNSPAWKGMDFASKEKVEELLFKKLKLDRNKVHLIKGWFNETLPLFKNNIGEIALLHLDCDLYESVKFCLKELYDNVIQGGFVVIDDYGYWKGCKKAVDEFIEQKNLNIELIKVDYPGVYFLKKMKIVIITPYWLSTKGGITTAAYYLSNELKRNGHSVWIVTPDSGSGAIKLSKNRLILVWEAIRILRDIKPEVVHVHAHGSLLFPSVIYKILFNKGMRIIFTFHTQPHTQSFLTGKPAKERGLIRLTIFNRLLRYCDATTYVSRSLMNSLEKTGIKIVKPVVIPNGVIEKKVSSEDIINFKQKYNLIDDYPVLCMIASLAWDSKVKGIEILIQAFKKVLSFQLRSKLLIVGDGQYRKYLEDYVEKENLEKKVIFTGNMDNPFIALSACDIYCHISLNEACPIAPLEAMIAGKPIIASNDAGLPEIITDDFNGILVDSNPNSIAKAILSLVENPNLVRKLSENAIISAKTKFSWEKITREYIKLYKNE